MKHKVVRVFCVCMAVAIFCCCLMQMCFAASGGQESALERIYDEFEEVKPDEMLSVLQTSKVKITGYAGQDVYVETEDGRRLWCADKDNEVIFYLKFLGYEPVELSEEPLDPEHSSIDLMDAVQIGLSVVTVVAFGIIISRFVLMDRGLDKSTVNKVSGSSLFAGQSAPKVRFADVKGIDELMPDLERLVDCLKHPDRYREIGARPPKGVILHGPPGTGKTLLAKAIAGEADVPFFSVTGSSFVEKYVGVGAKRVRELYAQARKAAPCIVFIDEIDAVASHRGVGDSQEHDRTINALLAELDGFNVNQNVVTIVATNRLELLDDAFKRAGRFDVKLAIGMPDVVSREHILARHAEGKRLSDDVNLKMLAKRCVGFSGADLEALLNEAAMGAVGSNRDVVTAEDIDQAFFKVLMHGNKRSRKDMDELNRISAWHEAGHVVAAKLIARETVTSVTIAGTAGGTGGATFRVPKYEGLQTKQSIEDTVCVLYGGRVGEMLYFDGHDELMTTGAAMDIQEATGLLRDYMTLYGMGEFGLVDVTMLTKDSDSLVEQVMKLSKHLYERVFNELKKYRASLRILAEALLEKETLTEAEIDSLL